MTITHSFRIATQADAPVIADLPHERRGYMRTGQIKPFPYGDDLVFDYLVKDLRA